MTASGRMSLRSLRHLAAGVLLVGLVTATAASQAESAPKPRGPVFTEPTAFDVSQPLRDLARAHPTGEGELGDDDESEGPPPGEPFSGHEPDGAVQTSAPAATIASPLANFEGLRNEDNFPIYGGRVNPPDPVGDVGPSNYVEMVNLTFAVYDKSGNRLLGRRRSARSGRASRSRTAQRQRATRSSSTTRRRTAGSSRSSRPAPTHRPRRRPRRTTAWRCRRPAIRRVSTTGTRSRPTSTGCTTSPTIRSTASGRTRTCSHRATSA